MAATQIAAAKALFIRSSLNRLIARTCARAPCKPGKARTDTASTAACPLLQPRPISQPASAASGPDPMFAFAQWMVGCQRFELGHQLVVAPDREVGLDPLLDRHEPVPPRGARCRRRGPAPGHIRA